MSDELIGQHLGTYLIESQLGHGGMGVVYRALDERLRRTVALKVLPPGFTADADRRRRFEREARAAAAVTHACIATVYEVGESEGRVYIAMELVEGSSLSSRIAGTPMPLALALRVARDVARGLAKAHERSVVHRDLKPDNVMLTDDGEVKILDFGLARLDEPADVGADQDVTAAAMTMPGQIMGTPGYMSPEQAAGKATDARTDLFSLGVVLYEMVTGARPFRGDSAMDVIIALCRDEPAPPSTLNPAVTPDVERIIARCMAKRPADRYANARDLLAELDALDPSAGPRSFVSSPGPAPTGPHHAIAPTTSSPHTSAIVSAPPPPAKPRTQKRMVFGAIGLVALGAVGALALRKPAARLRRPRATTSQHGSPWGGHPITDDPPPTSTSAEALRAYADGLRAARDGAQELALERFARATALDPDLAAAHLQVALARGVERGREALLRALGGRASLDERDRAVLDAVAPAYTETPTDFAAASGRLAAVARRFPDDVAVLSTLGRLQGEHDLRASVASYRRASAIDPGHVPARAALADSLAYLGDLDGARRALTECLDVSPAATACLRERAYLDLAASDCAAVETSTRRWMLISREGGWAQRLLAYALVGQGKALDAVRETLVQARASQPAERRAQSEQEDLRALAALGGDLAEAARRGEAVETLVEPSRAEGDHATAALALAMVLDEQGRAADAARVGQRFLERREAWETTPRTDDRALERDPTQALLTLQVRAGVLTPAAAEAQRAARRAWWEHRQAALPEVGGFAWIAQYAAGASTTEEALAALAALPRFGALPPVAPLPAMHVDAAVGRTYLLAGRAAEALPALRRAAASCYGLRFPVEQVRAVRDLGAALAATGDRDGACAAYGRVVAQWGRATPRSVTAEDARARMTALGCR
jgi:serine/threonine-protein kinase